MATVQHEMAVGVFDKVRMAQQAVEELRAAGFMEQQIGLVARSVEVTQIPTEPNKHDEQVSEGALGGILTGAGLGSLFAVGIEVELLPALGELILGGFFTSLFAGAIAGAAAGGIAGALLTAGLTHRQAEHYAEAVKAGRIVVTVRSDDRYDEAINILRANGAEMQSGKPLI